MHLISVLCPFKTDFVTKIQIKVRPLSIDGAVLIFGLKGDILAL